MITRDIDEKYRTYVYLKLNGSQQVSKIRIPLWASVSIVDRCVEFDTYHGAEAPTGKMSVPLGALSHFETRWMYAENDDD